MKLFKSEPLELIRVCVSKHFEQYKYFYLIECNLEEAIEGLKNIISNQNLSIFAEGKSTMITVRKAVDGKNGESKNISFKGLSVEDTYNVIMKNLK
jgi:hypothetical protein